MTDATDTDVQDQTTQDDTSTDDTSTQQDDSQDTSSEDTSSDDDSLLGKDTKDDSDSEVEIPESYELQMPEGRELDEDLLTEATPVFKELKLSQEGAQKLADVFVKFQEKQEANYKNITDGWRKETIKSLGANHQEQIGVATKFIDKFGSKEVKQVLNETGLGSHPEVVKMMINAGKYFGDDSVVTGKPGKATSDPERAARKMFPNTKYD